MTLGRHLLAGLLEEDAADRGLARLRRKIDAGPAAGAVAVDDSEPKEVRHSPRARVAARIADEAQPAQHAAVVEQHGEDHRVPGDAGAGALGRVERIVDGAPDIFRLVVEPHIDLMQAALLGAAFGEAGPVLELEPWRSAIAAAGELAEAVGRHRLRLLPEL